MTFLEIAAPLAARGIPQIRLRPRTKIAMDSDWPSLATTDLEILKKWSDETPDANTGCVAQAVLGGIWMFEVDSPEALQRIEKETGQKIPLTFRVRSRPGRGHVFFKQTSESIALGNVAQGYVKNGDFSVRISNEYCVGAGSLHPITGEPYEVVCNAPMIEAPIWLIDWIKSQRTVDKKIDASAAGEKIPYGRHDSSLTRIAGKLRHDGMEEQALIATLTEICEKRCENYGADYREMCEKIAHSVCRYAVGKDDTVLMGGKSVGTVQKTAYGVPPTPATVEESFEKPTLDLPPYPTFPSWVMLGTSINEGLVKPYCDVNSRYAEYMFMPAMALMLNYVANKVRVEHKQLIPSLFMVLIGRKGKIIKSSSVESAIEYFKWAGMVDHGNTGMENANGKALVWEIGSPEGLGIEMSRLKCKNGILFYDELSTLTNKAGIDGSTLTSRLLALYESGKFQNLIKSKKDSFSFDPGTYCVSLIACCTDKNFLPHWSKLSGKSSGLDDRFFFLYQPQIFKDPTPQIYVETGLGALETRKLVDKAIKQGVYKIENSSPLVSAMADMDNRQEIRAEKFALYFAIDLDRDEIDLDCIERGLALVAYEKAVKKYLDTFEASTKEGAVQMELRNLLTRNRGEMSLRDVERGMHPERFGTSLWNMAYQGLIKNRIIQQVGSGRKGDPYRVILMQVIEDED